MTSMPRSGPHHLSAQRVELLQRGRSNVRFAYWRAACMALGATGCIYLGPITLLEDENVPPAIYGHTGDASCQEAFPELEEALCVDYDDYVVYVIAEDVNDDALEFYWWGSVSGPIENAVASASAGKQSSTVRLQPGDMIDGEVLKCVVSGGSPTDVTVSWTLVVNR